MYFLLFYGIHGSSIDDFYIVKSGVTLTPFKSRATDIGTLLEFKKTTVKTIKPDSILIPDTDVSPKFLLKVNCL